MKEDVKEALTIVAFIIAIGIGLIYIRNVRLVRKQQQQFTQKLIESIDNQTFGQVFITDARPERTEKILANVKVEVNYIRTNPSASK